MAPSPLKETVVVQIRCLRTHEPEQASIAPPECFYNDSASSNLGLLSRNRAPVAAQNIPVVAVASLFQKDPFVLLSHPGAGLDRIQDLPKATAFIGKDGFVSLSLWLKRAYGFRDDKVKPYTFNSAPFVADTNSIEQGYATSEPFAVE